MLTRGNVLLVKYRVEQEKWNRRFEFGINKATKIDIVKYISKSTKSQNFWRERERERERDLEFLMISLCIINY